MTPTSSTGSVRATSPYLNERRREKHEVFGLPAFAVGQIWARRVSNPCLGKPDHWRIEAITDHPDAPVIARSLNSPAVDSFGLDGHVDGDDSESHVDLVALVRGAL